LIALAEAKAVITSTP